MEIRLKQMFLHICRANRQKQSTTNKIWLLTIYSKSEMGNIPAYVLRQIAKEIENVQA